MVCTGYEEPDQRLCCCRLTLLCESPVHPSVRPHLVKKYVGNGRTNERFSNCQSQNFKMKHICANFIKTKHREVVTALDLSSWTPVTIDDSSTEVQQWHNVYIHTTSGPLDKAPAQPGRMRTYAMILDPRPCAVASKKLCFLFFIQ